jgi:hypothetical protein
MEIKNLVEQQAHQLELDNLMSQDPEIRAGARRRLAALPGGVLQKSARKAESAAEAERATYLWAKANPTFALEANFQVMKNFLAEAGIQISADTDAYDLAFRACRNQLAERVQEVPEPTADEIRIARNEKLRNMSKEELHQEVRQEIKRKLATPEYGGYGQTYVPNFTASEFKRMAPSQAFAVLRYPNGQKRPGVEEAINKLLQDAVLSSSNSAK